MHVLRKPTVGLAHGECLAARGIKQFVWCSAIGACANFSGEELCSPSATPDCWLFFACYKTVWNLANSSSSLTAKSTVASTRDEDWPQYCLTSERLFSRRIATNSSLPMTNKDSPAERTVSSVARQGRARRCNPHLFSRFFTGDVDGTKVVCPASSRR